MNVDEALQSADDGAIWSRAKAMSVLAAEVRRLRETERAAEAVVRAWASYRALPVRGDLAAALDELARATRGGP